MTSRRSFATLAAPLPNRFFVPVKTIAALSLLGILLANPANAASSSVEIPANRLLGQWYRGTGTGANITLHLRADGGYTAVWTDVDGATTASTHGTWALHEAKLDFTEAKPKEKTWKPIRKLDVVPEKHGFVLVPPDSRSYFAMYGSTSGYWCFQHR